MPSYTVPENGSVSSEITPCKIIKSHIHNIMKSKVELPIILLFPLSLTPTTGSVTEETKGAHGYIYMDNAQQSNKYSTDQR